ncbi:MAG: PAS domain S-box protein [Ignavibacteriae bacterium]|nr:PAS domain S-box protein [Ignavibacteriota bacterium]
MISFVISIQAQTYNFDESFRWVHYTTESGLPSNQISAIYESADSTIWVSTSKGPAWYNGYRWIALRKANGEAITEDVQFAEYHDSIVINLKKEILIGSRTGFHTLINNVNARPVSLKKDSLFLLREGSLSVYANGKMDVYNCSPIPVSTIITMWKTASGLVWFRTRNAGYRLKDGVISRMYASPKDEFSFIWAAENISGTGLFSIFSPPERRGLWEWTKFSKSNRNPNQTIGEIVQGDILPNGDAIVVHSSGEVQYREQGVWRTIPFSGGSFENFRTVRFDKSGDLWFGTSNGLYLFRAVPQEWTFKREPGPDLRNNINEILKARNGTLWIASSYGVGTQQADGTMRYFGSVSGTSIYGTTALAEDDSGMIWIGSGGSFPGTYRWDGKRWKHFPISDTEDVFVHKIRKDRNGRLWFLGLGKSTNELLVHQPGAYLYSNNTFTRWGKEEGLISGRVYAFVESNDGAYWFGTIAGLSRWKNGNWRHWISDKKNQSSSIFSLAAGLDENVWGTMSFFGEHLFQIGPDDSMQFLNPEQRTSEFISDLKIDSAGILWATTTNGLLSFNGELWTRYDRRTGLRKEALQTLFPTSNEIYCATVGHGLAILLRQTLFVPPPIITIADPVIDEYSALVQWMAFSYRGELPPEEISTRFKLNDREWSPWSKQHEVKFDSLQPGSYTIQVQAKGAHSNINRTGQHTTFLIEQPVLLRPLVLYPLTLTSGMIIILIGVILVRKRTHNRELSISEAKFRSVVTTTTSAIIVHRNGKIVFFNPYSLQLTGFNEEEMKAKSFYDLIHVNDQEYVKEFDKQSLTQETTPKRFDCMIVTKSNDERWWDVTAARVQFQNQDATIVTAFDITENKNTEERMRDLTSELTQTEERERRRMASYLHDVISQTIAVSKMKLRRVLKHQVPPDIEKALNEVHALLEQSLTDAQTLTFELCPPVVYESDFAAAIQWLADQFNHHHSITVEVIDNANPKDISEDFRNVLFQAIREALSNVVKHANAQSVTISINSFDSKLQIEVSDNGTGFDQTLPLTKQKKEGGFGLFNIGQRLRNLGGKVEVSSASGEGTTVIITTPLLDK